MKFDNIVNEVINSKELKVGKQVEKEHKPTIKKIKKAVVDGKVKMKDDAIETSIAKDHIKEFPRYYTKGLKPMEKKLKKIKEMVSAGVLGGGPGTGGSVGNSDTYAPGDARVPKSLFGSCKCGKKKKGCKCCGKDTPKVMRRTMPGM